MNMYLTPQGKTYLSVQKFDFLFSIDSYRLWVDLQRGVTRINLSSFITELLNFKVARFLLLLGLFEPIVSTTFPQKDFKFFKFELFIMFKHSKN